MKHNTESYHAKDEDTNYHTTKPYDAKTYHQPSHPETSYFSSNHQKTPTYSEPSNPSTGHHSLSYPSAKHHSYNPTYQAVSSHHEANTYKEPTYKPVYYYPPPEAKFRVRIRTRRDYSCCKTQQSARTGVCEEFSEECTKLKKAGKSVSCNTRRFT